jgi:hypothetical protein
MKFPDLPTWVYPVGGLGVLGALWAIFGRSDTPSGASPGSSSSGGGCSSWAGDGALMQAAINAALGQTSGDKTPSNWMWTPAAGFKPKPVATDGRPGAMTCRAAEWLVANGNTNPGIAEFARSKTCGCGKKRAPCGVSGPVASADVKAKVVAAGVARGYPAEQVTKALSRESGWKAMALNCQGADKHPVAGGLNGMLNSIVRLQGFEGAADQFAALTAEEQLPYVLKFISKMPKANCAPRAGEFGLALFTPGFVCKPESTVIYEVGTAGWEQNPGLRSAGGGPVTVGKVLSTG